MKTSTASHFILLKFQKIALNLQKFNENIAVEFTVYMSMNAHPSVCVNIHMNTHKDDCMYIFRNIQTLKK